ncbi:hypothetical protein [Streptomyces sp. NPDC051636]|uniref:hypothetical protein n=1 Tax=Streptomyces sp. NPDC051636 TaxID=3365663 RepID=UPI00378835DA
MTSPRPRADRETKRRCYRVTLFSDPENDDYRELCTRPYGRPLTLTEPFGFELETADFL